MKPAPLHKLQDAPAEGNAKAAGDCAPNDRSMDVTCFHGFAERVIVAWADAKFGGPTKLWRPDGYSLPMKGEEGGLEPTEWCQRIVERAIEATCKQAAFRDIAAITLKERFWEGRELRLAHGRAMGERLTLLSKSLLDAVKCEIARGEIPSYAKGI